MGSNNRSRMGDNSWAVNDGEASLMPSCAGGCGIYDFSGTVPNHVYYEYQWQLSKDDIKSMSMCWCDGDSQHLLTVRKGKKGLVIGHADFTAVVGSFDDETDYNLGVCQTAVVALTESYKEQGY